MSFDEIISIIPYSLAAPAKEALLTERLRQLTQHHIEQCPEYASMMRAQGIIPDKLASYYDIPPIPVRLFKTLDLKSVGDEDIFKVMTSSGTTGQAVSKIYLDRTTASNQQKTLVKIVSQFTGASRLPLLIVDSPAVVKDRAMFSARGAGILGFSIFASDKAFALTEDMQLDLPVIQEFLDKHAGKPILLFGFTFIVWLHFYQELVRLGCPLDLSQGVLIHGGGWKKLVSEAVSKREFKLRLHEACGIEHIHDYYGMVEQTGCISMECEEGHLHTSVFSDIIMRRSHDLSPCDIGEPGIIEVVSTIPESYPGHCLLTEDEGVLLGIDDCPCGRLGKYFEISGRLARAELRGCGDTYAASL